MSKLIQRIERLGKSAPAPMGFGAASRQQPSPQMVLVGSTANLALGALPERARLDAVLFRPGAADAERVAGAGQGLGGVPWGVLLGPLEEGEVQRLVEGGCDFVAFQSLSVPLEVLHQDDLGRLLLVSYDLREEDARAMEPLPLDAALLSEPVASPLTLERLLRLSALRGDIGMPFLVHASSPLTPWEVECLREVGVEGLVADADALGAEGMGDLADAIRAIPRRRSRGERPLPTLPQVGAARWRQEEEQEEEEEDL